MKLSQKQSNAWHYLNDQTTTELLYGGAAGGGKSYLGCLWHIDRRVRYPGSRGFIGRKELKSIKESTLITYLKVAQIMGYRAGIDFKFNAQDMVINWSNGSRTVFKALALEPSDPNFESLGSTEFTDAFIDEAGEITEKAFDIINSRIRWMLSEFGLTPKILLSCNPNINWLKHKYIKNLKGDYIELKNYQKYISAKVDDNPDEGFKKLYKESLSKMNEYDKARLLFGDWDAIPKTGGEFYKKFDSKVHLSDCKYRPDLALHISWDENVHPYLPCVIFQIEGKTIYLIDTILGRTPNNTIKAVCSELKRKYRGHESGLFVYGDATSQKEDVKLEKGHNFFRLIQSELIEFKPSMRVSKSNPSIIMRGNFFNTVLESNFGGIKFFINRLQHEAIMDFEQTKEGADGKKDKKSVRDASTGVSFQEYGHITDATDYLLCNAFANDYIAYQKGGVNTKMSLVNLPSRHSY
jgi:phage terminase large subunit